MVATNPGQCRHHIRAGVTVANVDRRQMTDIAWIGNDIFRKAAINRITCVELFLAQGFPPAEAMTAVAASRVEPWHTDAVPLLHALHTLSDTGDKTNAFMARNKWWLRFDGPVAFGGVKIG